ncbi:MAG TPA: poly(R)-hydroxyalkanoic acid synthase subunit PhaE [Methylomirabilota bacterium]|nr:poly(R)-hydroxyalkanoic acid synthase subunit PhaE [Methylomirabilota bacterium]
MAESSKVWTEQMDSMAKAWTEAQKTIWGKWFEFMRNSPAAPPQQKMAAEWSKLTQEGIEAWTANAGTTAKAAAQRLFASQETWMRSLEVALQAWSAIAPKIESGEDWQSALARYGEELRQRLTQSPEKLFKSAQDSGELWRLYMEEFQKLAQPWVTNWQQAGTHLGAAVAGDGSALMELSRLYWDSMERSVGRLFQSPGLGSTRELNDKFAKGFEAWQELREAGVAYQLMLADAGTRVLEESLKEMISMAGRGETIQDIRQWVLPLDKVADPVLTAFFASDDFVRVQGRLLNASMAYWIRQREIIEQFLKIADIPTRTEVDELHQTLYAQRKEIKALKKTLAECTATIAKMTKNGSEPAKQKATNGKKPKVEELDKNPTS